MTHDDLSPWQNTPLVQALTAPAAAGELSGEGAALAAFQSSPVARSRRRGVVRFLGTGMTSLALLGALGGGVAAAAYTKSLPDSVQSFFHDVLGPIGVPAPVVEATRARHVAHSEHVAAKVHAAPALTPVAAVPTAGPGRAAAGRHPTSPARTTGGNTHAAKRDGGHPATAGGVTTQPSAAATPTPETTQPAPSPSPSPTPAGPVGDPSTWSLSSSLSQHVVTAGRGVQVSGTLLDAAGQPVAGHRVVVRVHLAGTTGSQQVAVRRTAMDGTIHYWLGNLTRNQAVVLAAGNQVRTQAAHIVVLPVLTVSIAQSAGGSGYVVTVSATGGNAGDVAKLFKRTPNGWQNIGQSRLDGTASASFAIPAPKAKHRYVVRLPATNLHGYSQTAFSLQPL